MSIVSSSVQATIASMVIQVSTGLFKDFQHIKHGQSIPFPWQENMQQFKHFIQTDLCNWRPWRSWWRLKVKTEAVENPTQPQPIFKSEVIFFYWGKISTGENPPLNRAPDLLVLI